MGRDPEMLKRRNAAGRKNRTQEWSVSVCSSWVERKVMLKFKVLGESQVCAFPTRLPKRRVGALAILLASKKLPTSLLCRERFELSRPFLNHCSWDEVSESVHEPTHVCLVYALTSSVRALDHPWLAARANSFESLCAASQHVTGRTGSTLGFSTKSSCWPLEHELSFSGTGELRVHRLILPTGWPFLPGT